MRYMRPMRKPPNEPIESVRPLQDGILEVNFFTGNKIWVNFTPRFQGARFGILQKPEVWESVVSHGDFVHWYRDGLAVVEVAYDELLTMVAGEQYL